MRFLAWALVAKEPSMPNETREARPESPKVLPAWGMPGADHPQGFMDSVGLWLTGGASLLAWTGLALWLTA